MRSGAILLPNPSVMPVDTVEGFAKLNDFGTSKGFED